jgi:hypothetical protein
MCESARSVSFLQKELIANNSGAMQVKKRRLASSSVTKQRNAMMMTLHIHAWCQENAR